MKFSSKTSDDERADDEGQVAQEEQDEIDDDVSGRKKTVKYYKRFTLKSTKSNQYIEGAACAKGCGGLVCTHPDKESLPGQQLSLMSMFPRDGNKGKVIS